MRYLAGCGRPCAPKNNVGDGAGDRCLQCISVAGDLSRTGNTFLFLAGTWRSIYAGLRPFPVWVLSLS